MQLEKLPVVGVEEIIVSVSKHKLLTFTQTCMLILQCYRFIAARQATAHISHIVVYIVVNTRVWNHTSVRCGVRSISLVVLVGRRSSQFQRNRSRSDRA